MGKKKHIFILGATRFDSHERSTTFTLSKLLAKNNFVYYIDYPITWKDYIKYKNTDLINNRKAYFSNNSDGIKETDLINFKLIIIPPLLSINFLPEGKLYRMLLKLNEKRIVNRIIQVIKKFNIKDYVYINSFNFHYPGIADSLNPALTVYHCVDPMIMPYDMKHGIISENSLVKNSDIVICTSKQLQTEKKSINPNTFFVPNAADINHSSKALDDTIILNKRISLLKNPVIGYIGTIERRIDFKLLNDVIAKNQDKEFVFVGPVAQEYMPEWFTKCRNVHLIGRVPYEDLPSILKGFNIAIIPFKNDDVSSTIFPLKLFEYLGAGKPVVSTNFNPDLKEFTLDTVSFCDNASSFSEALNKILKSDNKINIQRRLTVARENTWEKRADQFESILDSNILNKQNILALNR